MINMADCFPVAKADAFVVEAIAYQHVWTIRHETTDETVLFPDGNAVAFWSLETRLRGAIDRSRHAALRPVRISTTSFMHTYLPRLSSRRRLVAVNWSGADMPECVMAPEEIGRRLIQTKRQ